MAVITCPKCKRGNPQKNQYCWNCNFCFVENANSSKDNSNSIENDLNSNNYNYEIFEEKKEEFILNNEKTEKQIENEKINKYSINAFLILLFLWFLSSHHIVLINNQLRPIRRITFSFSEPFSNIDEITSMPWFSAMNRYPLTIRALQNAGLLESDSARENRIQEEVNKEINNY